MKSKNVKYLQKISEFLAKPLTVAIIGTVLVLSVWTIRLVTTHNSGYDFEKFVSPANGYTSDDAAIPTILYNWQAGYGQEAVTGDDNWFLKWPIFYVTNNLPISPLERFFVSSFVVLALTAVGVCTALFWFIRKKITGKYYQAAAIATVSMLLAAVPSEVFRILKWPSSRNIELVIFLVIILSLYCFERRRKTAVISRLNLKIAALVGLIALLFADDPLFMYIMVPPLLLVLGLQYFTGTIKLKKAAVIAGIVGAGTILGLAFKNLLIAIFPLQLFEHSGGIAQFIGFLSNLEYFFGDGLKIIGADIFGRTPTAVSTMLVVVHGVVAIAALAGIVAYALRNRTSIFANFILAMYIWTPVLIAVSAYTNVESDKLVSRYLIVLPFLNLLGIVLFMATFKLTRQYVIGLSVAFLACFLTIGLTANTFFKNEPFPNDDNLRVIEVLREKELTKGYAKFGDAGLNTFLSDQKVQIISSICQSKYGDSNRSLQFFDLLIEQGVLEKKPADKSFYLNRGTEDCTEKELERDLGEPSEVIRVPQLNDPQAYIYIYEYDIGSKLDYFHP